MTKIYEAMQAETGLKVGDKVKILRASERGEWGWDVDWNDSRMANTIGQTGKIAMIHDRYISVYFDSGQQWGYPFFVLELIEPAKKLPLPIRLNGDSGSYQAEFKEDGSISVGCQTIDFEAIKKIYKVAKSVREEK